MHKFHYNKLFHAFLLREGWRTPRCWFPMALEFFHAMTGSVTRFRDPYQPGIARVYNGKILRHIAPSPPNPMKYCHMGTSGYSLGLEHPWCCYMHGHVTCIETSRETSHPSILDGGSIESVGWTPLSSLSSAISWHLDDCNYICNLFCQTSRHVFLCSFCNHFFGRVSTLILKYPSRCRHNP
jgi:hypothetical protein